MSSTKIGKHAYASVRSKENLSARSLDLENFTWKSVTTFSTLAIASVLSVSFLEARRIWSSWPMTFLGRKVAWPPTTWWNRIILWISSYQPFFSSTAVSISDEANSRKAYSFTLIATDGQERFLSICSLNMLTDDTDLMDDWNQYSPNCESQTIHPVNSHTLLQFSRAAQHTAARLRSVESVCSMKQIWNQHQDMHYGRAQWC